STRQVLVLHPFMRGFSYFFFLFFFQAEDGIRDATVTGVQTCALPIFELLVDRPDARRTVGDIYLGTVEAVLPGIQAAFVNIGAEKSAFLHASDLIESEDEDEPSDREDENGNGGGGANRSARRRLPNVADELKRGEAKMVQVIKEPIGTKGPRVTAQISLAGRFLVYMPFASKVGVSRKIENREQRAKLPDQGSDP